MSGLIDTCSIKQVSMYTVALKQRWTSLFGTINSVSNKFQSFPSNFHLRSKSCAMRLSCGVVFAFLVAFVLAESTFRKVVVQSVYKETGWMLDEEVQNQYGFSVFAYQKLDPQAPNYFKHNRGTETGVYLKYIVDHYHDFPDVAVFVHAHPTDHNQNWLQMVRCINPNATWFSINFSGAGWFDRSPEYW